MSQLIANISGLMKEKGWNGKTLAERSGQKMSAIYNILAGRSRKPSADKVEAIARAFGVTTAQILYGTMDKPVFANDSNFDAAHWDGVLYSDCLVLVRSICRRKKVLFSNPKQEKDRLMYYAQRVYKYAQKSREAFPNEVFADEIISEDAQRYLKVSGESNNTNFNVNLNVNEEGIAEAS